MRQRAFAQRHVEREQGAGLKGGSRQLARQRVRALIALADKGRALGRKALGELATSASTTSCCSRSENA